ncbi:GH13717 [Drosophila grimshawi]|uniref:GH13717 n=1 Tax=Drosophila grimshawi TaxID=7222 RepID=B4JTS4_DROGR|nr:GH13717 [Drosophila grimshawi]
MVNVPPPLLCSTPPPIDFGEDDDDSGLQSTLQLEDADEYSEYGLVSDTHEAALNAKVLTLPELPISSTHQPLPNDLSNGDEKSTAAHPVEAFNYQVRTLDAFEPAKEQQMPTSNQEEQHEVEAEVDVEEEEEDDDDDETNTNDNVPSLKLDSLSLYSSESISPTCTLSPVADEQAASKAHAAIVHQVTLEDVTDDSDEECSPKKPKELFIPEGAADFFAIEILHTPTPQATTPALSNPIPDAKQEFALPTLQTPIPDPKQDFTAFPDSTPPPQQELNGNLVKDNDAEKEEEEDDDFW